MKHVDSLLIALLFVALTTVGGAARAQVPPSDTVDVQILNPLTGLFVSLPGFPFSVGEGAEGIPIIAPLIPGFPLTVGSVYLLEPGTQQVSDILTIQDNTLFFFSDGDPLTLPPGCPVIGPIPSFPGPCIPETGAPQDVTALLGITAPNVRILLTSDVETVPAPATLALVAAGLLGLAGARRWRGRAKPERARC